MKKLSAHQRLVMHRLRHGEYLTPRIGGETNRASMKYGFSTGGEITERTFRILRRAGLLELRTHPLFGTERWKRFMGRTVWFAKSEVKT